MERRRLLLSSAPSVIPLGWMPGAIFCRFGVTLVQRGAQTGHETITGLGGMCWRGFYEAEGTGRGERERGSDAKVGNVI